jgi:hypothetical protein
MLGVKLPILVADTGALGSPETGASVCRDKRLACSSNFAPLDSTRLFQVKIAYQDAGEGKEGCDQAGQEVRKFDKYPAENGRKALGRS